MTLNQLTQNPNNIGGRLKGLLIQGVEPTSEFDSETLSLHLNP